MPVSMCEWLQLCHPKCSQHFKATADRGGKRTGGYESTRSATSESSFVPIKTYRIMDLQVTSVVLAATFSKSSPSLFPVWLLAAANSHFPTLGISMSSQISQYPSPRCENS